MWAVLRMIVSPRGAGQPPKLVTLSILALWDALLFPGTRGALPTQRNVAASAQMGRVFWRGGFCTPPMGPPSLAVPTRRCLPPLTPTRAGCCHSRVSPPRRTTTTSC